MSNWQGAAFPHPVRETLHNLWAGCHLLVFRRSALRWQSPRPLAFVILLALSLATSFAFDLLSEGFPGEWSPPGMAVYCLPTLILLVFGQVLANRHGLWRFGLAPACLWLSADILLGLVQCLLQFANQQEWLPPDINSHLAWIYTVLFVWPVLAVVYVFTRALLWPRWERVLTVLVLLGAFSVWSVLFSDARLWYANENEDQLEPAVSGLTEERIFYDQPELLNRALKGLQPERAGKTDWYFLGVGGAFYQDVFRTEVETVRQLFDTRFSTRGRSLVLVNNNDTLDTQPIATRTSIRNSLFAIASKMDREQDVLFLFLSSHGSDTGEIELNFWPLQLAMVTPEWLRMTLDETGIRHRVIVLSACYSGAFLPVLATPDTLVITAAEAGRPSFGCDDDADLTYFGRAFLDEAMRREYSFHASYERAVEAIAERERRQGFAASNPQWQVGERMSAELPELEKGLFPPQP